MQIIPAVKIGENGARIFVDAVIVLFTRDFYLDHAGYTAGVRVLVYREILLQVQGNILSPNVFNECRLLSLARSNAG